MTISCVINVDTRTGYLNDKSTVGEFGNGSLQGVRSSDFFTEGIKNKMSFFRGYDCQCILYVDVHEDISVELMHEIESIVYSYGNNSKIVLVPHNKNRYRWNDWLYIDALKLAEGDYVAHFDQDANAIRTDESNIIEQYFNWLDNGHKYVCQPWDMVGDIMHHASTRFFICKRKTLDFPLIERSLITPLNGKHNPCLEYTLAILAGENSVIYPPRQDEEYIVFSWAKYYAGTLKKLNEMEPKDAINYILALGLHGANDVVDKQFNGLINE